MIRRPRIGTVLLLINLVLLVLPLSGIWVLRLYESALIRQTESELIAQGAVMAAAYRVAWRAAWRAAGAPEAELGPAVARPAGEAGPWRPQSAGLDLAQDPILPVPPLGRDPGQPAGAVARAAGAAITGVLREAQAVTLAGVRVVDARGVVVATTREELGLSLAEREEVAQALAGQPVSLMRCRTAILQPLDQDSLSRGADLRVFTAVPILEHDRVLGAVVLSRTPRTLAQTLYGKRWELGGVALLLLAAGGGLAVLAALTIARPLRAVTDQAKRVADGAAAPLPALENPRVRELAELSEALQRMADTLDRRAEYIRDFAAQVSHEFKTPLTAIRGAVELLRDHLDDMSADDRNRFLDNLRDDAARLDRLVRRLLELARADVSRGGGEETTPLAPLLASLADRYRRLGLRVDLAEVPDAAARMPAEALDTVLGSLLDNIRAHAGPAATASLACAATGDEVIVTVADDGPGISAANAARVFDRFFTTARKAGGTGLGLAIAHSLATAHHGSLRLLPAPVGARFELRLPRG